MAALIRQPGQADFAQNTLKLVQGAGCAGMATMVAHRPAQPPLHLSGQGGQGGALHYRTFGWPGGMSEVTVALCLSEATMVKICLLRKSAAGGFDDICLARMRPILPDLAAAYTQH